MRRILICILLALPVAAIEPATPFPSDPEGVTVIDRNSLSVSHKGQNTTFYAVLQRTEGLCYLDVYKGLPWTRIHHWPIVFEGQPVDLAPVTVLHIIDDSDSLVFHWDDFAGYREGAVKINVTYERATGTFKSSWVD